MNEDPDDLALAARALGLMLVRPDEIAVTPELLAQIPAEAARALGVFPCGFTELEVRVVLADPFDRTPLRHLSVLLGKRITGCTAPEADVEALICRWYGE